jgi:F0F1-type ATP synthase membrane subunit b/b'
MSWSAMDTSWIIYTVLTVFYIVILVVYFIRRSKSHEEELKEFLDLAQEQLESHKLQASSTANQKVTQALNVVKKVQQAARSFETQAEKEYQQIIEDAKVEKRELIAKAKTEIEDLFKKADRELEAYKAERHQEIEKNLVKLVIAVTEKVVESSLTPKDHESIIHKALEEIKQNRARS